MGKDKKGKQKGPKSKKQKTEGGGANASDKPSAGHSKGIPSRGRFVRARVRTDVNNTS